MIARSSSHGYPSHSTAYNRSYPEGYPHNIESQSGYLPLESDTEPNSVTRITRLRGSTPQLRFFSFGDKICMYRNKRELNMAVAIK